MHNYLVNFHKDLITLCNVMHRGDPRDITNDDLRIITQRDFFAKHLDPDPPGLAPAAPR